MKIVLTFPADHLSPGGGARSCLQIARHLEKLGAKVILMPVSTCSPSLLEGSSIPIRPVKSNKLHYFLTSIHIAKAIQKIEAEEHVDAVLCWDTEGAFLSQSLKKNGSIFGMIAAYPSYYDLMHRSKKLKWLVNLANHWFRWRLLKAADVVFVSSYYTKSELIDLVGVLPNKIKITYRGIDPIFLNSDRAVHNYLNSTDNISNFIFYGSFAPIKGVFDVIEALSLVYARGYQDWKLKIAGWGKEEAEVRHTIERNGIAGNVQLLGKLPPTELVHEIAWADLAILPSRAESFGRAIAEAQAVGIPVISYDSGSVPEVLAAGQTGWVVPATRADLLADAIVEAIDNPSQTREMGQAGRERVKSLFSWEKTAAAILEGIEVAKKQCF